MTKKLKTAAGDADAQLADAVRISAQQIWQAGLGAFVKAQQEGERAFSNLVKEGSALQQRAHAQGGEDGEDGDNAENADHAHARQSAGSWHKLEQIFEDRVLRALGVLDVPTRADVAQLEQRIDALAQAVAALTAREPAALKTARKPAVKTATKTAAKGRAAR